MSLFNSILTLPFIRRLSDITLFKKYPAEVQAEMFRYLIDKASDTAWGRIYDYKNLNTISDYKKALKIWQQNTPLSSYDDLKPWIDRAREGEADVLWPGLIKWFAVSSGTSNDKSKYIPVTEDFLEECHYQGGKDVIALYVDSHPETKLFSGKTLSLGGSKRQDETNPDNYCGDLSAILMDNLPFWAELVRTPELPVALMNEWETKLKEIVKSTKNENVVALAGVPSWMLILLRKILSENNLTDIKSLWPNLELFMHGGVAFGPYREQYKKICGPQMNYVDIYNASEGFFGIACEPNRDDLLLMLDYGIFYEFIPLEELDKAEPQVYILEEVELNRNYALVISTSGGLWRYLIGDTICFTELKPYYFKISGRTKHFINVFGEELMIDNADQAIVLACNKTGALVKEYTAAPVFMSEKEKGRHQWLIEFEKQPQSLSNFVVALDDGLKSLNSDYEAKRYKDITLLLPELICARPGLFYDWLSCKNKLGGQYKVPRLSNDRSKIEEMLKFLTV